MFDDSTTTELLCERSQDAPLVEALIADAFGPGRFVKAAERLREGARPNLDLSFVAWADGKAVGCVRLWPIAIGSTPAILLGPFAVDAAHRSQGLGAELISRACQAATEAGHALILLVGDMDYFAPLGFSVAQNVVMRGPVDRRRVLVRALKAGAADELAGAITRAPSGGEPILGA